MGFLVISFTWGFFPQTHTGNSRGQVQPLAASAMAFMVFVLLYFPCIATLAAIKRETESWGYTLFTILYNTGLAWILAWITYRIASMV